MTDPTVNPYEAVQLTNKPSNHKSRFFKRFLIALFSFFIAFWAGAITLFICVVLHEKGVL